MNSITGNDSANVDERLVKIDSDVQRRFDELVGLTQAAVTPKLAAPEPKESGARVHRPTTDKRAAQPTGVRRSKQGRPQR